MGGVEVWVNVFLTPHMLKVSVQLHDPAVLFTGKESAVFIAQENGSAPEPVCDAMGMLQTAKRAMY
jgi:hypothetical protein